MYKALGHRLEVFPLGADGLGFLAGDGAVGRGHGDDAEHVREFLHDVVGGRDELLRIGLHLGIGDEEAAGKLAHPLGDASVAGGANQLLDAIEGIVGPAAGTLVRWLGPFVDKREGQAHLRGDLLRAGLLEDLLEQFV